MSSDQYRRQRNWGARIHEYTEHDLRTVALENERLRIGVLAGKGTDIIEFLYKPLDLDFVFLTPNGVRNPAGFLSTSPDPLATFVDTYPGGWQEVFPNAGAPASWAGAQFGQHGEVTTMPWDVAIRVDTEERVQVDFDVQTLKSPFRIVKSLELLAGSATLAVREIVRNQSDVEVRAMWGHHLAFGRPFLDQTCRIILPDGVRVIPHAEPIHPEGRRVRPDEATWPVVESPEGEPVDLSQVAPPGTISDIVYLTGFEEGWYEIEHPTRDVRLRVEWDVSVMPYLWYWMEYGATKGYPWYGRLYTIGLEPNSSYPTNGLPDAVANGSALTFGPREERQFDMAVTVLEPGRSR
jgi:hypothetical protein